jgi:hypothetical protein
MLLQKVVARSRGEGGCVVRGILVRDVKKVAGIGSLG